MTETSNYALNIVEGSDLFNPLTQFNPNFEQIDTVMAENEQAGVGTATELKSGTTHAITRENNNRSMFYFTATSDYEDGDTFTVDGAVVTAKLPSGESLGAGAFVVNSTVLCSIVGSLLTVYSTKGGVTTAADSERLGGELPAYYATAEDLLATDAKADSAGSVAQSANAISIQNQSAINDINTSLNQFSFGYTSDGKPGYKVGASTEITPFRGKISFSKLEFGGKYTSGNLIIDSKNRKSLNVLTATSSSLSYGSPLIKGEKADGSSDIISSDKNLNNFKADISEYIVLEIGVNRVTYGSETFSITFNDIVIE